VRAVAQRVREARIRVDGETVGEMGAGLLALVGVTQADGREQAEDLARRLVHLRIFADASERMNRSLLDIGGTLGIVSQFTLFGDARHGRRPSFGEAAPSEHAEPLLRALADAAVALGASIVTGRFRASMEVELVNAGPVTILLDTEKRF
jgi:D-tyrosyl-tRNA(Tyr) deacylase